MKATWASFGGVAPRLPAHRLPHGGAQFALNCDFAKGDLVPYGTPALVANMRESVKAMYTPDGIRFLTWPIDADALRGPVVEDRFKRVYYTVETGGLFVTFDDQARIDGGQPASKYKAGVIAPTGKPLLTAQPYDPGVTFTATFFYEAGGVKYQETPVTLTQIEAGKKYSFVFPAKDVVVSTSTTTSSTSEYFKATGYTNAPGSGNNNFPEGALIDVQIASPNQIKVVSSGLIYSAYELIDDNGALHSVAVLFSLAKYTFIDTSATQTAGETAPNSSQTPAGKTPDNAFPAMHLVANLTADNNRPAFDSYSIGSSFQVGYPLAKITLAENPADTTTMLVYVEFEQGSTTLVEDRAYVYTYVNSLDEESAPSPPSVTAVNIFQRVSLSLTAPNNAAGYAPVTRYRIYRTATGANGQAEYFKVGDGQVADGAVYLDTMKTSELSTDTCESWIWEPPPTDLVALAYIGNGMFAGISGTDVRVCEPYRPHSWPAEYGIPFPSRPLRVLAHGNTALVTTTAYPYIITGSTPSGLTQTRLTADQAAVAKLAHADLGGTIAYASNDGIVLVTGGVASVAQSLALWGRDQWRLEFGTKLAQMKFAVHDGQLLMTVPGRTYVVRFDEAAGAATMSDMGPGSGDWHGMFVLPQTDSLYVSYNNAVYKFAGSATQATMEWWSNEITLPKPANIGVLQLLGEGSFEATVYADGTPDSAANLVAPTILRLKTTTLARRWSVKVRGQGTVERLTLANTVAELRTP